MKKKMMGKSTKFHKKKVKVADNSVGNLRISIGSLANGTKGAMTANPLLRTIVVQDQRVKVTQALAPMGL